MAIPERFLEELVARCDISDVVADYVPLTKKGSSLWGLCPFHSEKTPSFSVNPDRQIYHCFGCNKGGGVISFVMEMENLPFPDAVRLLAKRSGMEMPETGEDGDFRKRRERLLALNRDAARYYYENLKKPEGAAVAEYIVKRKLLPQTVTRFGLGASLDAWDTLLTAMTGKGYDKRELLEAGLVAAGKGGSLYDKFRNRLMLPVIDLRGDVVGFTSRSIDGAEPKYLNTPETPLFRKRSVVYALNFAKSSKRGSLILVEGNLDVITLHQAGFDNAVATMGTALTDEHARILSRYTKELVVCYDNDDAGKEATRRALGILKNADLSVKVLQLPRRMGEDGKSLKQDADDFIKYQGAAAFERMLGGSVNHIDYRLSELELKYDLKSDEDRIAYLKEAAELLAVLQSPVEREVYGNKAAAAAGISSEVVASEIKRVQGRNYKGAKKKQERAALAPTAQIQPRERSLRYQNPRSARAEEGVVRLALLDPTLLRGAESLKEKDFTVPFLGRTYELLRHRWREGRSTQISMLDGALTPEEMGQLTQILQQPEALERGREAMGDYLDIIETEHTKRTDGDEFDSLMAARDKYREKKGYGGGTK